MNLPILLVIFVLPKTIHGFFVGDPPGAPPSQPPEQPRLALADAARLVAVGTLVAVAVSLPLFVAVARERMAIELFGHLPIAIRRRWVIRHLKLLKKDIFQIVNCLAVFVGCRFMDLVPRNMRFARGCRLAEPSESDPAPVHATKPQESDETEIQGTINEDEASTLTKVNSKLGILYLAFFFVRM
jgi:hypothetical protein